MLLNLVFTVDRNIKEHIFEMNIGQNTTGYKTMAKYYNYWILENRPFNLSTDEKTTSKNRG